MPGGFGDAASGAGTGAAIGSFIPGIGTAIGAGIGALGGWLFGHHDSKPKENPEDPYKSLLTKSAASSHATGEEATGMGLNALQPALDYFRGLVSNNAGQVMDATRQERGRIIDQYDTAKQALAQFGARGGGTTSALANSQFKQAESLADVTSGARAQGAQLLGSLSSATAGIGLSAESLAHADLDTVLNSILAREGLNVQKHGQNMGLLGDIGTAIGQLVGLGMGGHGGGGGGVGSPTAPIDNINV